MGRAKQMSFPGTIPDGPVGKVLPFEQYAACLDEINRLIDLDVAVGSPLGDYWNTLMRLIEPNEQQAADDMGVSRQNFEPATIVALCNDNGEPTGWYGPGHVDLAKFIADVEAWDLQCAGSEKDRTRHCDDARHCWAVDHRENFMRFIEFVDERVPWSWPATHLTADYC